MNIIEWAVNSQWNKKLLKKHLKFNCPNCLDIQGQPCTWCLNINEAHLPMEVPYSDDAYKHFANGRGY